eukprot:5641008-Ditylum_brightwellii.AAC.1
MAQDLGFNVLRYYILWLSKTYKLKGKNTKEHDLYLGATIEKFYTHEPDKPEKARWSMSSYSYTKKIIEEVELELAQVEKRLQMRVETPLSSGYHPKLDILKELDPSRQNYYLGLVGILRWICKLG